MYRKDIHTRVRSSVRQWGKLLQFDKQMKMHCYHNFSVYYFDYNLKYLQYRYLEVPMTFMQFYNDLQIM